MVCSVIYSMNRTDELFDLKETNVGRIPGGNTVKRDRIVGPTFTAGASQAVATHLISAAAAQRFLASWKCCFVDLITFSKLSTFWSPRVQGVYLVVSFVFLLTLLVTPPRNWLILGRCVCNSSADGQLEDGVFNIWCHMTMIHSCIMLTMCFWHSN